MPRDDFLMPSYRCPRMSLYVRCVALLGLEMLMLVETLYAWLSRILSHCLL